MKTIDNPKPDKVDPAKFAGGDEISEILQASKNNSQRSDDLQLKS